MSFLSAFPTVSRHDQLRWRKTSAPPQSSPAMASPAKPHSRSVDSGQLAAKRRPPRAPVTATVPAIAVQGAEPPSSQQLISPDAALSPRSDPNWSAPESWMTDSPYSEGRKRSMDVPLRMERLHRRIRNPKMSVSIPAQRSKVIAYNPHRLPAASSDDEGSRQARPTSPRPPTSQSWNGPASAAMPLARPPRSAPDHSPSPPKPGPGLTLRGLGLEPCGDVAASSSSLFSSSSGEHVDEDGSCSRSGRTSMSSVGAETAATLRGQATDSSAPRAGNVPARTPSHSSPLPTSSPRPQLRSRPSAADRCNKPLPPEPVEMTPAPLQIGGRPSFSRSASSPIARSLRSESPAPGRSKTPTTPAFTPSLKSKYAWSDLDSIDRAFQQSSPRCDTPGLFSAEQALQAHLSTINEQELARDDDAPVLAGPLQISRGPMQMVPSRAAPSPPKAHLPAPPRTPKKSRLSLATFSAPRIQSPLRSNSPSVGPCVEKGLNPVSDSSAEPRLSPGLSPRLSPLRYHPPDLASPGATARAAIPAVTLPIASPSPPETARPSIAAVSLQIASLLGASDVPTGDGEERMSFLEEDENEDEDEDEDDEDATDDGHHSFYKLAGEHGLGLASTYASSTALPLSPMPVPPNEVPPPLPLELAAAHAEAAAPSTTDRLAYTMGDTVATMTSDPLDASRDPAATTSIDPLDALDGSQRRGRRASMVMSLVSFAVSEVPDWYLNMPSSTEYAARLKATAAYAAERNINAESAEAVILSIFRRLDSLPDLFAAAVVSRGFYRTFKRNELGLMKHVLRRMSAPAWELREMSRPSSDEGRAVRAETPTSYLRGHLRDMYIAAALKSLMVARCSTRLRPATVRVLAGVPGGADDDGQDDGERSRQMDEAFWRVWTFCTMFGHGKHREDDVEGQLEWLRGSRGTCCAPSAVSSPVLTANSVLLNPPASFGGSNRGGLGAEQLADMLEIWAGLEALVHGFHGRVAMARHAGVFDHVDIPEGAADAENAMLDEWVAYLLTLGPSVVLDLATPSNQTGAQGFVVAAEHGLTTWTAPAPGCTRKTFLKAVVSRLYQEQRPSGSSVVAPRIVSSASAAAPVRCEARTIIHDDDGLYLVTDAERPPSHASPPLPPSSSSSSSPSSSPPAERRPSPSPSSPPPAASAPSTGPCRGPETPRSTSRQASIASTATTTTPTFDQAVWDLVSMGFPVEQARRALLAHSSTSPAADRRGSSAHVDMRIDVSAAIDSCLLWAEEHTASSSLLPLSLMSSSSSSSLSAPDHGRHAAALAATAAAKKMPESAELQSKASRVLGHPQLQPPTSTSSSTSTGPGPGPGPAAAAATAAAPMTTWYAVEAN